MLTFVGNANFTKFLKMKTQDPTRSQSFYGEFMGVRTARKHIGWYVQDLIGGEEFRQEMNLLTSCEEQLSAVKMFFDRQASERLQYRPAENKWAA